MYNSGNSSKNVTGASIVDGTVETVDIADDAVTADKLANSVNTDIATGVSGSTTAGDALPKAGGALTGAVTTNSTFDGRDVATDGAALDVLDLAINSAADAVAITIDASEYVGVGTAAPLQRMVVSGSSAPTLELNRSATTIFTTEKIAELSFTGDDGGVSTVGGSISVVAKDNWGPGWNSADMVFKANSGTSNVERMRIAYNGYLRLAGAGIQFNGDTAAANALDDYETGTATLTLTGGTSAPSTAQTQTAYYTKIGDTVTIHVKFINKDITGASGQVQVTGLPFTSTASVTAQGSIWCNRTDDTNMIAYITTASTSMDVVDGVGNPVDWVSTGAGTYGGFTITYKT